MEKLILNWCMALMVPVFPVKHQNAGKGLEY